MSMPALSFQKAKYAFVKDFSPAELKSFFL